MRTEKELIVASKAFAIESRNRSWWELLVTLVVYFCMLGIILSPVPLLVKAGSSIICGLLMVRMFVIYHDYRHRAILQGSTMATWLMKAIGVYLLAPEQIWMRSHEHHHNNNSKLTMSGIGSYPTISKTRFLSLGKMERRLYLINRHPLTIIFGYLTLFIYWLNLKSFLQSPGKHKDSLVALVFHVGVGVALWYFMGFWIYVMAWFVPFFIMSGMGSYLFYCQHNFPAAQFKENHDWTYVSAALSSTSFMVMGPVMRWFTACIGYHHVHHINSRIPFYRLAEAMHSMPELNSVGTTSFNPIEIFRCLRLKLWDEERERMITLRQLRQVAGSR